MTDKLHDELADRRAKKAIMEIRISAGDASIVKQMPLPAGGTRDPAATLRARRRRRTTVR